MVTARNNLAEKLTRAITLQIEKGDLVTIDTDIDDEYRSIEQRCAYGAKWICDFRGRVDENYKPLVANCAGPRLYRLPIGAVALVIEETRPYVLLLVAGEYYYVDRMALVKSGPEGSE